MTMHFSASYPVARHRRSAGPASAGMVARPPESAIALNELLPKLRRMPAIFGMRAWNLSALAQTHA